MPQIILPPRSHVHSEITLLGSKSLTNRALILASLSRGTTRLYNLLHSDDTRYMREALAQIGVKMHFSQDFRTAEIEGLGGKIPAHGDLDLFLGNAGTAMRFLTAFCSLQGENLQTFTLRGIPRMHQRPIGYLVDALREGGAEISYVGEENFPPLAIQNKGIKGGKIRLNGSISSQFLSALLLVAPYFEQETEIEILGKLISEPYVAMTIKMMEAFGVRVKPTATGFLIPAGQGYQSPLNYFVEGDASSASYFLAAGALGGRVKVHGISKESLQGDAKFAEILAKMGAKISYGENWIEAQKPPFPLKGIDLDANAIPDSAMTLVPLALFARGESTIRNVASWRVKETDRLNAMATELRRIGAEVFEGEDFIRIKPLKGQNFIPAPIETYDDHRMAMCFALMVFFGKAITIKNPQCVHKTFPQFFKEWANLFT